MAAPVAPDTLDTNGTADFVSSKNIAAARPALTLTVLVDHKMTLLLKYGKIGGTGARFLPNRTKGGALG